MRYALIIALAGILFGYDTGIISGAILWIKEAYHLSTWAESWLISLVLLGAFFGAILSARVSDWFGRKYTLIFVALLFMLSTLICAFAHSLNMLLVGRFLVGAAVGVAAYLAPLFISELAPKKHRGFLVSLNQVALVMGILISYAVCYAFSSTGDWRMMFGVGIIPATLLFVLLFAVPESPRWLISKNKKQNAFAVLNKLRVSESEITDEIQEISQSIHHKDNWRALFKKPINKALFLGCALTIMQQFTGINSVLYFAPTILLKAGIGSISNSILATLLVGIVLAVSTLCTILLLDKVGRKPLLFFGLSTMAVGLLIMALNLDAITVAIGMLAYVSGFAFALGSIVWLMIVEIFPLSVRGLSASIATAFNWLANLIVTLCFLPLVQSVGISFVFSIFFILTIMSLVFVFLFVPETKGISLEKIEDNLFANKRLKDLGAYTP